MRASTGPPGLLIGYRDARRFEEPADQRDKIEYLFALPPKRVSQKVAVKDNAATSQSLRSSSIMS